MSAIMAAGEGEESASVCRSSYRRGVLRWTVGRGGEGHASAYSTESAPISESCGEFGTNATANGNDAR